MTASERSDRREEDIQQTAESLYSQGADWATFFRETLGLCGVVRRNYPTRESMAEFEQTEAYLEIQRMLTRLRRKGPPAKEEEDPTKVITVRLPKSIHDALLVEAHEHRTSMNKLCISKLLQFIDSQMVPTQT